MKSAQDTLELLKARRSVRKFDSRPLTGEEVDMLIEAMRWAPSGGNRQPWAFYVVRSAAVRTRIAEAARNQTFVAEAPVVITVAAVPAISAERYGVRGESLYSLQDTAAAVQNCLVMARSMGLGTCWIGSFNEEDVARILDMPPGHRPVAIIPVGHPAEEPNPRPRREAAEVVTCID